MEARIRKRIKPFPFFLFLLPLLAPAQDCPPERFRLMLRQVDTAVLLGQYDLAINKLQSAKTCQPDSEAVVNRRVLEVFGAVNAERTRAIKNEKEAKRQEKIATAEKEKAEAEARRIYANDLAFKSQITLRDGDRNTAFRLAEFAQRYVDEDNEKVVQALVDALYYNDNYQKPPLPRVANLGDHNGPVFSVDFSPDGKRLAIGANSVEVWDLVEGKASITFPGDPFISFKNVAFSPDGKRLAAWNEVGIIIIWDLDSGEKILALESHSNSVHPVTFSPDGKRLATGSDDNTAKIWDLDSEVVVLTLGGHTSNVNSVAFSPDGKRLATGSSVGPSYKGVAKIWDIKSGKAILSLEGHDYAITSVAFSPAGPDDSNGGKYIATGSYDTKVKIWNLAYGKTIRTFEGHTFGVTSIAFSPNGKFIATEGWDNTLKIFSLESGKAIFKFEDHMFGSLSVAFSPDGKRVATGSSDNTAKIWEITADGLIHRWQETGPQADLTLNQLQQYNLESLLDLHPDNEQKLIATRETWQIKAFADLAAAQAAGSNIPAKVEPAFARADRLYAAALALQDERLIRQDYAAMLRRWVEVYQADGQEQKAAELEAKAKSLLINNE